MPVIRFSRSPLGYHERTGPLMKAFILIFLGKRDHPLGVRAPPRLRMELAGTWKGFKKILSSEVQEESPGSQGLNHHAFIIRRMGNRSTHVPPDEESSIQRVSRDATQIERVQHTLYSYLPPIRLTVGTFYDAWFSQRDMAPSP